LILVLSVIMLNIIANVNTNHKMAKSVEKESLIKDILKLELECSNLLIKIKDHNSIRYSQLIHNHELAQYCVLRYTDIEIHEKKLIKKKEKLKKFKNTLKRELK